MEDKTKSTLAHVASIATAIAGIATALLTGKASDSKGEKIYETLRENVTIQGEHIKMLEEDKRVKDAWILQHLGAGELKWIEMKDGDGIPDEDEPVPKIKETLISSRLKTGTAAGASKPKPSSPNDSSAAEPPPPPPEPVQIPSQDWGQMPDYNSL